MSESLDDQRSEQQAYEALSNRMSMYFPDTVRSKVSPVLRSELEYWASWFVVMYAAYSVAQWMGSMHITEAVPLLLFGITARARLFHKRKQVAKEEGCGTCARLIQIATYEKENPDATPD